jgi:hypothetical protein
VLGKYASALHLLSDRVRLLEEVDNPPCRARVGESAPPPLEQLLTFSFRLSDRFWRETLCLSEDEWNFVRSSGSFVGSVELKRWRSHTVATITEVLPNRKTAAWRKRSIEYQGTQGERGDSMPLWEILLSRPRVSGLKPTLKLSLRQDALELSGARPASKDSNSGIGELEGERVIFFRTPLDPALLPEFRSHDPAAPSNGNGSAHGRAGSAAYWQTFYSWEDESLGLEWQLSLRDLTRKAEWEHWRILESPNLPPVSSRS